jgi:hypothetical protein
MTTLGLRGFRLALQRGHDDAGSIVFGWLSRVAITITFLGVVGFEVLSIAVTHVSIEDVGRTAGDRALTRYADTHDPYQAYLAADEYVSENGAELVKMSFEISSVSVSFVVKKTAPTLLLYRLDATAGLAEVETKIYAEPIEQSGTMP